MVGGGLRRWGEISEEEEEMGGCFWLGLFFFGKFKVRKGGEERGGEGEGVSKCVVKTFMCVWERGG